VAEAPKQLEEMEDHHGVEVNPERRVLLVKEVTVDFIHLLLVAVGAVVILAAAAAVQTIVVKEPTAVAAVVVDHPSTQLQELLVHLDFKRVTAKLRLPMLRGESTLPQPIRVLIVRDKPFN